MDTMVMSKHNYFEFERILNESRDACYKLRLAWSYFDGRLQKFPADQLYSANNFMDEVVDYISQVQQSYEMLYKCIGELRDMNAV